MVSKDKAYIVANEQQEREVLDKLYIDGMTWCGGEEATQIIPSDCYFGTFPYVIFVGEWLSWNKLPNLEDEEIVFDGRKEDIMADKDKAYIVNNKVQELGVLTKLEQEGYVWYGGGEKPTEWIPSKNSDIYENFPIAITIDLSKHLTFDSYYKYFNDENYDIVYDGREEEDVNPKTKISKEVYDGLVDWKHDTAPEKDFYTTPFDFKEIPFVVKSWWLANNVDSIGNNNRLIAIIRWVNGEDVFEVEKPKKWVVRSKIKDGKGGYWFVHVNRDNRELSNTTYRESNATKFDTKEEAESWANAHQEVVEVDK